MAFDVFYALHGEKGESPLEFMVRMGWEREAYQMLAVNSFVRARSPKYNLRLIPSGYPCFRGWLQEIDRRRLRSFRILYRWGKRRLDEMWSLRLVQQRVIPPERQNIGQILRENGMQAYDELPFLVMNQGRSCQDECYLEEMKGDETI